jgi:hypothetical protein
MVQATKEDNLDSITEKILSGKDLKDKMSIYLLFTMTHPHYTKVINMNLAMFHPDLHGDIRKAFFPTTLDKIKKLLGLNKKINALEFK